MTRVCVYQLVDFDCDLYDVCILPFESRRGDPLSELTVLLPLRMRMEARERQYGWMSLEDLTDEMFETGPKSKNVTKKQRADMVLDFGLCRILTLLPRCRRTNSSVQQCSMHFSKEVSLT